MNKHRPARPLSSALLTPPPGRDRGGRLAVPSRRGGRSDDGTAIAEFALIGTFFGVMLLGIISFGFILAFKQNITRAAAEGVRAGAVAPTDEATVLARTQDATDVALDAFGRQCGVDGLTCEFDVHSCLVEPFGPEENRVAGQDDCISVRVTYDHDSHPIIPSVWPVGEMLPETIVETATAHTRRLASLP